MNNYAFFLLFRNNEPLFQVEYVMMDGGSANHLFTSMLLGDDGRRQGFSTPNIFDFTRSVTIVQDSKHCFKKKSFIARKLDIHSKIF